MKLVPWHKESTRLVHVADRDKSRVVDLHAWINADPSVACLTINYNPGINPEIDRMDLRRIFPKLLNPPKAWSFLNHEPVNLWPLIILASLNNNDERAFTLALIKTIKAAQ